MIKDATAEFVSKCPVPGILNKGSINSPCYGAINSLVFTSCSSL